MKARDVAEHMRRVGTWVDWDETVDTFKVDDPAVEVEAVAVTWIVGNEEVRQARDLGCNLIVCHEPVFYLHRTDDEASRRTFARVDQKRQAIEEAGITIFRCHDVWDRMPAIGIPYAWAAFLGLRDRPAAMDDLALQHVYPMEPVSFRAFAERVSQAVAGLGEEAAQVVGDPARTVSRVGIGTGCASRPMAYVDLGADVGVVCDDGTSYWGHIQWARDVGFPVVRVNHGTSEEPGMVTLAAYLREQFPAVPVHHIRQGCRYRLVRG